MVPTASGEPGLGAGADGGLRRLAGGIAPTPTGRPSAHPRKLKVRWSPPLSNDMESVQSRTPVLLRFLVELPSVDATGRWKEEGEDGQKGLAIAQREGAARIRCGSLGYNPRTPK